MTRGTIARNEISALSIDTEVRLVARKWSSLLSSNNGWKYIEGL